MVTELKVISDIYSPPDKKGNQKLVKSGVITRLLVNTVDVRYVEEIVDSKGKVIKDSCSIKVDQEQMRIKHTFDEIKKLVCPEMKHAGLINNK